MIRISYAGVQITDFVIVHIFQVGLMEMISEALSEMQAQLFVTKVYC